MIKAVFMDVDNTLLDFNASAKKAMEMAFDINGLRFEERYFYTFKKVNDGLWRKIETGELTRAGLHAVRFDLIFGELGIDYDGKKVESGFLDSLNVCAVPVEGAEDILQYLSAKYLLCSASNAPCAQQHRRLAVSGLKKYFRHMFISEEIGFNKPDIRFFEACFKTVAPITPGETAMIGDSLTADIAGGKACGAFTVWFNRLSEPAGGAEPDRTVKRLSEIKDIL